uniref:Uncharacterized protein n=1 Tax=Poecilia mexicana TaxID=48701 RepID=A0A3B3WME5_9TELE
QNNNGLTESCYVSLANKRHLDVSQKIHKWIQMLSRSYKLAGYCVQTSPCLYFVFFQFVDLNLQTEHASINPATEKLQSDYKSLSGSLILKLTKGDL